MHTKSKNTVILVACKHTLQELSAGIKPQMINCKMNIATNI